MARVLIVKGDAPSLSKRWRCSNACSRAAEAEGRAGIQIEALALQALAHWRHGDHTGALTSLERALRLAEGEATCGSSPILAIPMARLLQEAHSRAVLPDYVETLLAAFGELAFPVTVGGLLPEPLTAREQEVLKLIAAGMTNREIADQLVVSAETVKSTPPASR